MNNEKAILSAIVSRRNIDYFFWSCIIFLFLLLVLNLKEVMLVHVWRHDALYYQPYYTHLVKAEGRWINYFLFDFLKTFPAHASALLSISCFGGFMWIAANKIVSWEKSLLVTLLFLQISQIWSIIHWPAVILPAYFFLFFCAYLSRKYRYEYILALACILFHGTMNNLYNLIPLLFLSKIRTGRQLFRFFVFWLLFYVLGFAVAQFMTKMIVGQFIEPSEWRNPHYVTSVTIFIQNLKNIAKHFISHIHTFTLANFILCMVTTVLCLWKKIINIYQLLLLLCVGAACYVQTLPLGIRVDFRTVSPLYAVLLMPFCFALLYKKFRILVLIAILVLSIRMFTDNYNSLRYYQCIVSVYTEHLRTIPNDPRLNSRLIFCSSPKDISDVENHLMKTMDLKNRITEGLGELFRWPPSAQSLGYHVILMQPQGLEKCKFNSNQLYEWTIYNGAIIVRFNPELLKQIKK